MRRFVESNKFNKGFSLIEVLVAMVVITLISIPLLRTFVTSAKINNNAKKLQNATDIAQNVSENFTTIPLLTLMADNDGMYEGSVSFSEKELCGEYYKDDKHLVFKHIGDGSIDENDIPYFEGNDGEKFYVTVTMNPDEYSKNNNIVGVQDINDYIVPSMGDLFSHDVVTAYSQFTKYDNRVKTAFKNQYPDVDVFKNNAFDYEDIKKEIYVYINQKENGSKIDYEYRMTVKYIYCTKHITDYVESIYYVDYNFTLAKGTISDSEKMPELFLLYTPFDIYDTSYAGNARDEIYISYMEGTTLNDRERETKVYIIEQSAVRQLDKYKVFIKHHQTPSYSAAILNYGTVDNPKMQIYSTIDGWPQNVTVGNEHLLELYEVEVYVWYNKPDPNDVRDYVSGNYSIEDVYTKVSAIKEE